jgi:hypothetical protein
MTSLCDFIYHDKDWLWTEGEKWLEYIEAQSVCLLYPASVH